MKIGNTDESRGRRSLGQRRTGLKVSAVAALGAVCAILVACASPTAPTARIASKALPCDDGLKTALSGHTNTTVLLVQPFREGEPLRVAGASTAAASSAVERAATTAAPTAGVDLCLVKLLVGPGNPGPAGAPSTSAGIGIEVLLPSPAAWNERIRVYGNSGWSGTLQASPTAIASDDLHAAAAAKGFVVATSDNGHVGSPIDPSFAMNPDGSINTVGWRDFSERSLHELAEKTKALTNAYYGRPHRYAYWDGFSTGGRQALKLAQVYPDDFDGILVGAPAINWSKYHTAGLYAQIAMQQDLGSLIAPEKLTSATQAAIRSCGGAELGFLIDPLACRYDPTLDPAILCRGEAGAAGATGTNVSPACLKVSEARVINKIWYGQTVDGSAPAPAADNGSANILSDAYRLWFGWTRDTDLKATPAGGAPGLILAADQTALELQDPTLGSTFFANAKGKGANRWLTALNYRGLADAQAAGIRLQPQFSNINTDNLDLARFHRAGGKMLMYQGLSDEYIPAQGAINYYERVMVQMGGAEAIKRFYRLYLIPGFTHSGRSEGVPSVPVPQPVSGRDEMFVALQNWVERNQAPENLQLTSSNARVSLPLCIYPRKITYRGNGPATLAASYVCR